MCLFSLQIISYTTAFVISVLKIFKRFSARLTFIFMTFEIKLVVN